MNYTRTKTINFKTHPYTILSNMKLNLICIVNQPTNKQLKT